MKQPSVKTWELVDSFYAADGFWKSLRGRVPPVSLFEEIASADEQLIIPHIAPLVLHRNRQVREAAARCISRLIAGVHSSQLVQLDEICREKWSKSWRVPEKWWSLKPGQVRALTALPSPEVLLGIASFHNSGFVREAAVAELSAAMGGSELPFLLIRANDWVPAIREASTAAVLKRLSPEYVEPFLQHLPLVTRLRACGRAQHEKALAAITGLLKRPEALPGLMRGIDSGDRWFRRECFRLALESEAADRKALLRRVISDQDPLIRLWAVRELLPASAGEDLQACLLALSRDRFSPIRCEALNLLAGRFPRDAAAPLQAALLDSHSSVRGLARHWILNREPETQFAPLYIRELKSARVSLRQAAILGLGETGGSGDAKLLLDFLKAPHLSLRKAAIRSIGALDREGHAEELLAALQDQHPGVSREAAKALALISRSLAERFLSIFRSDSPSHVRRNAFRLLLSLPFWQRGIFLLEALRDRDEEIIAFSQTALRNWITRSTGMAIGPTQSELNDLRASLEASSGMLAGKEVRELEFCFRMFR